MLTPNTNERYIYILADGLLHEKVSESREGAEKREYETSDGKKGEKWELTYKDVTAKIVDVKFDEGDFGEQVQLTLDDGENRVVLTQGVSTNFGEDLLKKLPAIDFTQDVTIKPYSFTGDNGKEKRGVNIYQKSDKVTNFFYDYEAGKALNGFPAPTEDTTNWKSDDWKIHFLQVRKFLVKYVKERIVPKFQSSETPAEVKYPEEEIDPKAIPF